MYHQMVSFSMTFSDTRPRFQGQ